MPVDSSLTNVQLEVLHNKGETVRLMSEKKDFSVSETPSFQLARTPDVSPTGAISLVRSVYAGLSGANGELLASVVDANGQVVQEEQIFGSTFKPNKLNPGAYALRVSLADGTYIEQDFSWGVLALNLNKSEYAKGERAQIAIAVLDEHGEMVCDADVHLRISNDQFSISDKLQTKDGTIQIQKDVCSSKEYTLVLDYEGAYTFDKPGTYDLELTARTGSGSYTITDSIEVKKQREFDVERISATRIFPLHNYPVVLKVIPNKDIRGTLTEYVPDSFVPTYIPPEDMKKIWDFEYRINESVVDIHLPEIDGDQKKLVWDVDWKAGNTYYVAYQYDAPDMSPDFYTLGPVSVQSIEHDIVWNEARSWQIAVDDTSGPNSAGTGANSADVNTDWTSATNIYTSNDADANANGSGAFTTDYLHATNFGFSIPTGSTIDGIVVEIEKAFTTSGNDTGADNSVLIIKGGSRTGTNKASGTNWGSTDAYATYGTSTDLWGTTWTAADINSSDFGVALQAAASKSGGPDTNNFYVDHVRITIHYTPSVISVAGTANVTNGTAVAVAIDGSLQSGITTTVSGGTWTLSGITPPSSGANIIVFTDVNNTASTDRSSAVMTYSGSGNVTGMYLGQQALSVGAAEDSTTTIASGLSGDYDYDNDTDIVFSANSSTLTIDPGGQLAEDKIDILGSDTLTIATTETLATHDVGINGTLTATGNATFTVSGSWDNNATFNSGTSAVTLNSSTASETIESTGATVHTFYALTLNLTNASASLDNVVIAGSLDVNGTFTITDGELDLSSNNPDINTAGNVSIGASGTVTKGSGTWTFDGSSTTLTDSTSGQDLGTVSIGPSTTTTVATNSNITITSLTIGADDTLNISSDTLTVTGTGTPFTVTSGGTLTSTSSTVKYTGSSTTTSIATVAYNNLELAPTAATTYNLTGNLTGTDHVTGNLTIGADATLNAVSGSNYNLEIQGNWVNNGTFTAQGGTVTLDATSGTPTITSSSDPFYNLSIDNGGTAITWTLQDALDVNGNLLIDSNNTLASGGFQINVAGNWTNNGTFTHGSNTVVLDGAAGSTQAISGNTTFYTLSVTTGNRIITFAASSTTTIDTGGSLTMTGTSCSQLLVLRSATAGSQWTLTNNGASATVTNIDIQDGNHTGTGITAGNSVDSGNNDLTGWTIAANACIGASTNSSATGNSFQRKTFYDADNSRYWMFFHDGDHIEARYSSDGSTWSVDDDHIAYDTNDFSVWHASISSTEYVWLAVNDSGVVKVRRGTLSGSGVAWDASVITALSASGTYAYPVITLDSSNYIWIGAQVLNGSNYVFNTIRSDSTGDSTWSSMAFGGTVTERQITDDQTTSKVYGNIVSLASQDMYATVMVDTAVEGCRWDADQADGARWESSSDESCEVTAGSGGSGEDSYFDSLSTNLAGYWKMNETSWSGVSDEVVDSSGTGNHGTRAGDATTTAAGFNRSGTFDGTGDYVSVPYDASLDITDNVSISFWFRPTSTIASGFSGTKGLISKANTNTDAENDWQFSWYDAHAGRMRFGAYGDYILTTTATWTGGTWYHVTVVVSSTNTAYIYVNGELDNYDSDTSIGSDPINGTENNAIAIGLAKTLQGDFYFDGQIDEMRIYDRAISSEEVAKLYQLAPDRVNIDDGSDFGVLRGTGRQVVRTKSGILYSFVNDGGNCEMWKSSDGVAWAQQQSGTSITCDSADDVAMAIDGQTNQDIHVIYSIGASVKYRNYDTATDNWDAAGEENIHTESGTGSVARDASIAIDASNVPHVVFFAFHEDPFTFNFYYSTRASGVSSGNWSKTPVSIEGTTPSGQDITIDEDNIPVVSYIHNGLNDLTAAVGDQNNATSFTLYDVDADINDVSDEASTSIAVDPLTGDTWIAYVREDGSADDITLAKREDGNEISAWSTGWTIDITNDIVGYQPSIAIAENSQIYVFFESQTSGNADDIAYDVYDSINATWAGETVLQTGTFQDVKAKWSFEWNNFGANRIDYLFSDGTDVYWDYLYIRRSPTNIDNASDFGAAFPSGRQVVRTSGGNLYAVLQDGTSGPVEVWKSTDNGYSWSEMDAADKPTGTNAISIAIDSSDVLHIVYQNAALPDDIYYTTFATSTDQFAATPEAIYSNATVANRSIDIAIDSNDIPHVVFVEASASTFVRYYNRVGGSWGLTSVETVNAADTKITINGSDVPVVSYINVTDSDLTAAIGNGNDPSSFTLKDVDTDVDITSNQRSTSVGVDSSGNTWIAYVDSDSTVALAKNTGDWDTGWSTITTKTDVGYELSLAVDGTSIYVFYEDDQDDVVYDVYDSSGASWSGETLLEEHGALQDVKVRWNYLNNVSYATYGIDYVYSDGMDVFYNRVVLGSTSTPGAQDAIGTTTSAVADNFSSVSDGSGNVHLLYVDADGTNQISYQRWNGTSWSGTPALVPDGADTNDAYVTLSRNSGGTTLYAVWIDTSANDVFYSSCTVSTGCDAASEWEAELTIDTNNTNTHVDAGYLTSSSSLFVIYTKEQSVTGNPYHVTWGTVSAGGNSAPGAPQTLFTSERAIGASSGFADPVSVGDPTPVFSAIYQDSDDGDIADKYQVIVYSDVSCTADVWDSGSSGTSMTNCTQGNRCSDITYGGTGLSSDGTTYYWKIKFWDDEPSEGSFSDCAATFTMLDPDDQLRHGFHFFNNTTEAGFSW